eukprot:scaffold91_cov127-Cylindrotheca_fusiformis.AAC.26
MMKRQDDAMFESVKIFNCRAISDEDKLVNTTTVVLQYHTACEHLPIHRTLAVQTTNNCAVPNNMIFRLIVRKPQTAAIRSLTSRTLPTYVDAARKSVDHSFGTEAAALPSQNLVKDAIEKMMAVRNDEDLKPIPDEELELKFQQFQVRHEIGDNAAIEAGENVEEEIQCASSAVEKCFNGFIDLLEDLRRADDSQLEAYSDIRLENAKKLRELRKDLDAMMPNA